MSALKRAVVVGILVGAGIATPALLTQEAAAAVGRPGVGVGGVGGPGVGVGGPGAPVAGVARRTTRRMVRRTSIYVASLPQGCSTVVIEGETLYQCVTTYYVASGSQYEVVNVE
jgi:hypothetical protein